MGKVLGLLFFFAHVTSAFSLEEKPIVVVIPSYNNAGWYQLNLVSVLSQKYKNYRIIYIDDASPDGTGEKVEGFFQNRSMDFLQDLSLNGTFFSVQRSFLDERLQKYLLRPEKTFRKVVFEEMEGTIPEVTEQFAQEINGKKCFFTLVTNTQRAGALANLYRAIQSTLDEEIIVTVDGDDWLVDEQVLKKLNRIYSTANVWMTHGRLIEYPSGGRAWSLPIPPEITKQNAFRTFRCPSHLRTFYSWIFKKIALEDLLYEGEFFPMTWDMAIMFPIVEMAGERHSYIDEPNYVYNMATPISDNKVNAELQRTLDAYIRGKPPYRRLKLSPTINKPSSSQQRRTREEVGPLP